MKLAKSKSFFVILAVVCVYLGGNNIHPLIAGFAMMLALLRLARLIYLDWIKKRDRADMARHAVAIVNQRRCR